MASSDLDHRDILELRQRLVALGTGKSRAVPSPAAFVPSTLSERVSGRLPLLLEIGALAAQRFRRRTPPGPSSTSMVSGVPRRRESFAFLRSAITGSALAGVAYMAWRITSRPRASPFGQAGRNI